MKNDNRIKCVCTAIVFATFLMLTGCGHSGNFTSIGKVFKIGNGEYGLTYVNGLLVMNGTRENTESIIETNDNDGFGDPADVKTVRAIRYRTGMQINGYLVDLAEKSPATAIEYVKVMPLLPNKPVEFSKSETSKETSGSNASAKAKESSKDDKNESTTDKIKDAVDKVKESDYIQSLIEKVKSFDKKNGTEGQSGKADADDYAKTPEFTADRKYTDLYIYETVAEQRKMAQILAKLDDGGRKFETGETYKQTLEHFLDRLDKVEKWGGVKTAMRLKYATIEGGKLTGLLYIMFEDDRVLDVDCPSCHTIENAVYDDAGNPVYKK